MVDNYAFIGYRAKRSQTIVTHISHPYQTMKNIEWLCDTGYLHLVSITQNIVIQITLRRHGLDVLVEIRS